MFNKPNKQIENQLSFSSNQIKAVPSALVWKREKKMLFNEKIFAYATTILAYYGGNTIKVYLDVECEPNITTSEDVNNTIVEGDELTLCQMVYEFGTRHSRDGKISLEGLLKREVLRIMEGELSEED